MFALDFNHDACVANMTQPPISNKQKSPIEAGLNSLKNRLAEGNRTVELLCGKQFRVVSEEIIFENLVQVWMFVLMNKVAEGAYTKVQNQLVYLSSLSLPAQIAILSEAKKLAQKLIDENVTETSEENGYLLSIKLLDEKLQECRKENQDLAYQFPINIKDEKKLEDILSARVAESTAIIENCDALFENMTSFLKAVGGAAILYGGTATLYGGALAAERLNVGPGVYMAAWLTLLVWSDISLTTIIKQDGKEATTREKLYDFSAKLVSFAMESATNLRKSATESAENLHKSLKDNTAYVNYFSE